MGNYLPNSTQTFDAKKKCLEKNYNEINKNNIEDKKISNHKGSKPPKESSIMDTEIKENPFFFF